ncbi:translation initiation factor eIF-2B subunit epsilon-like isoform X1 [Rhagoletis pomonella]|uniref:translation initiation factor eIF-2B subunit epsilon-like isoform X1 n=1 Tax=Rhagoletis pomonella TaxID=28610 RepID=UPI00177F9B7C|nr:translation initiation factor eIF-2B subunit epsilon-like isoform X1 [Rhagoletis pomonella]
MNQFGEKEVIQAILIADNNVEQLQPFSAENSTALLPLVNVPLLDYALDALNRSGIEEVFVYSSLQLQSVREHIKNGIASLSSWSINMTVHVIGGEGCRCFGDAMRDLDAKALIRGNFILLGADTVTNANLRPIFEQHKKTVKYDKGAAATLVFKEAATCNVRTGNEIMIAVDQQNNRLHHHQRLRLHSKESQFEVPLEVFLYNSEMALMHNLIDPQIAIGSPSMLSLFSDNFDFETRDDFVRGILINEEILDSRIYVSLLPRGQYARKVNNWLTYCMVSQDVMNRWAYPLVPDMGLNCLAQQYVYLKNNIYKSPKATVIKATLRENVAVQAGSQIEAGTTVSCSVIGKNCKIGKNCVLSNVFLLDSVNVADDCKLDCCVIGFGSKIGAGTVLTEGAVVGEKCVIPSGKTLKNVIVKNAVDDYGKLALSSDTSGDTFSCITIDELVEKLGEKAFIIEDKQDTQPTYTSDSEDDALPAAATGIPKVSKVPTTCDESDYTSSSDDDESRSVTPLVDDTNIFLAEVMDSLARGFQEKSNPDFLILEINSSRYAYNMSLKEVNFYVVKAIFSLQDIQEPANQNVLFAINNVLKQLGPVMSNYIKTEDAMLECLKALEDIYEENEYVRSKISKVVHYLYDKDFVSEDAIIAWYEQLDAEDHHALRQSLKELIEWLNQSSEEEDDHDEEESD